MQIKIFTMPAMPGEDDTEVLNLFLRSHRAIDVKSECINIDGSAYWSFCVKYLDALVQNSEKRPASKIDYKDVLSEEEFARFARLRDIRKTIAEREAVPAYAIFTNEELAEIAKMENPTLADIRKINGIGKNKTEKYGEEICGINSAAKINAER